MFLKNFIVVPIVDCVPIVYCFILNWWARVGNVRVGIVRVDIVRMGNVRVGYFR